MNPIGEEQPTPAATADEPLPPRKRHEKLFAVLPTLLTLGNAVCGFGAITFAAKVGPTAVYGNELWIAACLIYVAMVFDMFDGTAARLLNQTSEFGALLDSLCDVVSFGVAPAFLMLQFARHSHTVEATLELQPLLIYLSKLLWVIAALFMVCAVLRLARFTVETDEEDSHEFFSGLPAPAAAGVVASFPLLMDALLETADDADSTLQHLAEVLAPVIKFALPIVTFVAACLMISKIRYPHFFNQLFARNRSYKDLLLIVFTLVLMALFHEAVLFILFTYFAFIAPLQALWVNKVMPRLRKRGEETEQDV